MENIFQRDDEIRVSFNVSAKLQERLHSAETISCSVKSIWYAIGTLNRRKKSIRVTNRWQNI